MKRAARLCGRLAVQSVAYARGDFPLVACEHHRIRDKEKPIERAKIATQKSRAGVDRRSR